MLYVERVLEAAFLNVWDMSVTAGYCVLAVLLIRVLLYRAPRKYLYALWLVVAFRLICPVSVNTPFSLFNLHLFTGYTEDAGSYSETSVPARTDLTDRTWENGNLPITRGAGHVKEADVTDAGSVRSAAPGGEGGGRLAADTGNPSMSFCEKWKEIWFRNIGKYVWISGVLAFALYFAAGVRELRYKTRKAVRLKPEGVTDGMRKRRGYENGWIYECDGLLSPFVMGVLHPRIYLPCGLTGEQKRMVLLHEQYHIYRKDYLIKYLSFGLLAVYWFHPLVWAAWFGMCRDMEMSCDEKVLELLGREGRKEYSRTLLSLASERAEYHRIPLAFGEQDVKKRILHILNFRKPSVWISSAAVAVIVLTLAFLGTNGAKEEDGVSRSPALEEQGEEQSLAEQLYEARNPYVGDASANGRLLGLISEAFPDSLIATTSFRTELQTEEEPYEFHFRLIKEPPETGLAKELEDLDMTDAAVLLLALTDNLGVVQWGYETLEGEALLGGGSMDKEEAARWCGSEDIREFAASAEQVQYLLDRIESLDVRPWDSSLPFMEWYADLPEELYRQAVPINEAVEEEKYGPNPRMYILARTEDQSVTVYGCSSYRYACRGITIVYQGPEGEKHYSFMDDGYWGGKLSDSGTEVYRADYDQDGSDEIALRRLTGLGRGSRMEELTIFEICNDGTLEASDIYTSEKYKEAIEQRVKAVVDSGNRQVHVLEQMSEDLEPEKALSSVPFLTVPYEEGQEVEEVLLCSDVRFSLGAELYLETTVGLGLKNFPGIWYGSDEEEQERSFRFRILYEESERPEGGHFQLGTAER